MSLLCDVCSGIEEADMRNDPPNCHGLSAFPSVSAAFNSGGEPVGVSLFDELASLFALAHMRSRRERVVQSHRSAHGGKRALSSLSRQVSLDDVATSAKLATGDGGILENERSKA